MAPSLTLKRAVAARPSGEWKHNDFDVLADGVIVGRIYEEASTPPEFRWLWSITSIVPADAGRAERHRGDARRGDGDVLGRLGRQRRRAECARRSVMR